MLDIFRLQPAVDRGLVFVVSLAIAATSLLASFGVQAQTYRIAVSQIVEHPALDATRQGLLDGLQNAGYVRGKNLRFTFQTAQGNPATAAQIARTFVGQQPDVLVGIATPTAQALAAATQDIPIVFTAVTDPVGARLVTSLANPGGNVTGLSDMSPIPQQVRMIKQILPDVETIGVVYNPGEANSVSLVEALKREVPKYGISVAEATSANTAQVQSATQNIAGRSDVIFALTDNTTTSAFDALMVAANDAEIPVYGSTISHVESGAIAAVGFDYYQIGVQTADYVIEILLGRDPASLPARIADGSEIYINTKAAQRLGITLPASLVTNATESF